MNDQNARFGWKTAIIIATAVLAVAGIIDALSNLPIISGFVPA